MSRVDAEALPLTVPSDLVSFYGELSEALVKWLKDNEVVDEDDAVDSLTLEFQQGEAVEVTDVEVLDD